ncbi:protein phosphatase 2C domain-containing protein [Streptomyces sp. enrichment culture]|uniref:protein phosphatase 2C domain-containing protein n=1 Tax=Streptomyces sp. enrichment culture TaxID=1795815 RepID=UPI003F54CECD
MSQQGGSPTGREDDWWGELYDDSSDDTGGAGAADSLDDRFASATGALGDRPGRRSPFPAVPGPRRGEGAGSPPDACPDGASPGTEPDLPPPGTESGPGPVPRGTGASHRTGAPARAPWEPPPEAPTGPVTFPPGPGSAPPPPRPTAPPPPPQPPPPSPSSPPSPPPSPSSPPPPTPPSPPPPPPPPTSPPPPLPANWPPAPRDDTPPAAIDPRAATGGVPPTPAGPVAGQTGRLRRPGRPRRPDRPSAGDAEYVGAGPPTYDPEPAALPPADPDALGDLVADTVLDGARYGSCTLRALSARGDSARYRGDPRRDALLTARFGTGDDALVLVAMATGARAATGAHRAAAELCRWIGRAVGRSHVRLAEDLRAARRGELKSGLRRLTDRSLGRLRASATEQGLTPEEYAAGLRCLLLPADPGCRTRVFFGVGAGGLFRLRDGTWQDIEPRPADLAGEPVVGFGSPPAGAAPGTPDGDRLTMDLGITTPPGPYAEPGAGPSRRPFRFRASVARPGDVLLLCTEGLADPLRSEAALRDHLAGRWSGRTPPGLAGFLADARTRVKGYADDRTAAAVWEA